MIEQTTGFQAAEYTGPAVVVCNCLGPSTGEKLCPCALNRMKADEQRVRAEYEAKLAREAKQ